MTCDLDKESTLLSLNFQALEEVIQFMETPGISEPTHLN